MLDTKTTLRQTTAWPGRRLARLAVTTCAMLWGAHALGAVITTPALLSVNKDLGGVATERGAYVSTGFGEVLLDPDTLTVRTETLSSTSRVSPFRVVNQTIDTNGGLGGTGISGSATSFAGRDLAVAELDLSAVNVPGGVTDKNVGVSAVGYQSVRFAAASTREVEVDVSYLLRNSVSGTSVAGASVTALSLFGVYERDTFVQTSENEDFLSGFAEALAFDLQAVNSVGSQVEVDRTLVFNALTNVDYLVWLGASASVTVEAGTEGAVDLQISAFADPIFHVADPNVTVVRTITQAVTVDAPASVWLLLVGLWIAMIRRRGHR